MSTTTMHRKARDTRPLGHLEGVTVLHCDQPDCDASFHAGMVQNRGGTRLAASARGWHSAHLSETNAFRDLCPTHGSEDLVQGDAKLRENSGDADADENHTNGSE